MSLPPHRVDYLPIVDRPRIEWPGGARVALWVAPNVEHYEYLPPRDPQRNPWPRTPWPEVQGYGYRDYGNRAGFWRMVEAFDRFEIRSTVSLNLAVFEHYPEIGAAMLERDWEVMSHGIYNTRYLHALSEEEEREFYRDCVDTMRRHTGKALLGMLGPAVSNSSRTPDLMAEAGLLYHADWMHDDQPVPIRVEAGRLVSVPYSTELNDVPVFLQHYDSDEFVAMAKAQFDRLYREGEQSGRVMCLAIHPYLMGMPHRIRHLEEIFAHVRAHDAVWHTTGGEIARFFLDHCYDDFVAHAARLQAEPEGKAQDAR
ncbi:MAG: polysaccharide deacetylase family protein [Acidimicrobiales bacterium]|nr:polysaccharide deacetylase family protein [Acidimicrobiales bacterium]